MLPYKLLIQDKAVQDSLRIKDYIKNTLLNVKAATEFVERLDIQFKKIMKNPHIYPTDFFGKNNYHYAMVKRYMIVFRVNETTHTVHIIAIGHSLQKRRNIIKSRK